MSNVTSSFTVSDAALAIAFADVADWGSGYQGGLTIDPNAANAVTGGWTLSFTLDATITDIWGAVIDSHVGNTYTVSNVWYNGGVSASNPAQMGFLTTGDAQPDASSVVFNGQSLSPAGGISTPVTTPVATPSILPTVQLSNISVDVGTAVTAAAAGSGTLLPSGYLSTDGGQIVDANGTPVQINAVNWYGMEGTSFAPQGLDVLNYKATMQEMVSLGFNTIRIPFSLQAMVTDAMPTDINYALNPDLQGLDALGVLKAIVAEAGQLGLKVILDDHNATAGAGPNPGGLWYDGTYSAAQFTQTWENLAQNFAGNATVIGFDLSNEPSGPATWGGANPATDWQRAATQTGDAVQAIDPGALVIVEGTSYASDLTGVATNPVTLNEANKLVYSAHAYPYEVTGDSYDWAANYPANLSAIWNQTFGYVQQQNIAPVLVGEYGSNQTTANDQQWMSTFVNYLAGNAAAGTGASVAQTPLSWAYWDWNPDSQPTGVLQSDWVTPNPAIVSAIAPALWHPTSGASVDALFTITLSAAATTNTVLEIQTEDGSAVAGVDYTALSGTITIAAGDTEAVVGVQLLDPAGETGSNNFFLVIKDANGNLIGTEQATLVQNGNAPPPTTPTPTTPPTTPTATPTPASTPTSTPANTVVTLGGANNFVTGPNLAAQPTGVAGAALFGSANGNATIAGSANDISITAYGFDNTIIAGGGNDTVNAGLDGAHVTVSNTDGNNSVTAIDGNNSIALGNGNNALILGGYDDVVTLGDGNNSISAGVGSSTIVVGNGRNTITTGGSNNTITVGTGSNTIDAGGFSNTVTIAGGTASVSASGFYNDVTIDAGEVTLSGMAGLTSITLASSFGSSDSVDLSGLSNGSLVDVSGVWMAETAGGATYATFDVASGAGLAASNDGTGGMKIVLSGSTPVATTPTPVVTPTPTPTPTPVVTPTLPTTGGTAQASTSLVIVNDWGAGVDEALTITNTGTSAIHGWQIDLNTTEQLYDIWNGTILSQTATNTVIGSADYDSTIAAGGSVTIGMLANHIIAGETLVATAMNLS